MKRILILAVAALAVLTAQAQTPSVPTVPSSPYQDAGRNESGFWWGADLSAGISAHHSHGVVGTVYPLEADGIVGWRFNDFFQAGVGFGVRYYAENKVARWQEDGDGNFEDYPVAFPLFAGLRGAFVSGHSRDIVPCWNAEVGYTVNDGIFFSPNIGLRILLGDGIRHHAVVSAGWLFQQTELVADNADGHKGGMLHAFRIKVGYQF